MAISKLMEENKIKALITENCDKLHRQTGMPVGTEVMSRIFEMHGNEYLETC